MSETMKKPRIRFKGFTEAWEQRKLGELVEFYNGDRSSRYPNDSDMVSEGVPFINAGDLVSGRVKLDTANKITEEKFNELSGAKIQRGDIIYCLRGTLGKNAFVDNFDVGTVASSLVDIRPKKVVGKYLYQVLNSDIEYTQRTVNDEGAAQPNLSAKNLSLFNIPMPDEVEQEKIAAYFDDLDRLITLHQRKYDKLLNIKKSMLEKMFPKNGNDVPEIRFKGFTDAWEQRKLRDIYDSVGNAFVGTATPYYVEQGHFYLESNNVKDGQINYNNEIFINDEFYEKQKDKWLHTGDIVMVQSGHVGHAAVIPPKLDNTAAHALIMFRKPKEKIEPYFLIYEYQTDRTKKKIENITTGNTIKHILASDMQKFEVDIPKYEEQKVIAGYFRRLDNLITLHQRKLEKLKNIKKSMLEKMFV